MLESDLMTKFENLKNKKNYPFMSGSIDNVFYYDREMKKHEDGTLPVCIKLEPEEKKKKKSLN